MILSRLSPERTRNDQERMGPHSDAHSPWRWLQRVCLAGAHAGLAMGYAGGRLVVYVSVLPVD